MHKIIHILWRTTSHIVCIFLCSVIAGATGYVRDYSEFAGQRRIYLDAEQALRTNQQELYQSLKLNLQGYPLLVYLDYKEASTKLYQGDDSLSRRFLRLYPDTRLAARYRNEWLTQLATQHRWWEFIYNAGQHTLSIKLQCLKLQALLAINKPEQAFATIAPLWVSGTSQPECDAPFAAWVQTGQVSTDLVWQRIAAAMKGNQPDVASGLKSMLSADDQIWLERWLKIDSNPYTILQQEQFTSPHPQRETMLIFGLTKLLRKNSRRIPSAWDNLKDRYEFTTDQRNMARRYVAQAYLRFASNSVLSKLDNIDGIVDPDVQRKRILIALDNEQWNQVVSLVDAMPPEERDTPPWQYWKGRALLELGKTAEAQAALTSASKDRVYYAFLAADRANIDYYLPNNPLQINSDSLYKMLESNTVRCAQQLRLLGRMGEARLEWRWLIKDLNPEDLQTAAYIASSWAWHDQAIFTLARSDYWDDLNLRFPLEYLELVNKYAQERQIPAAWIFAIMRQESTFAQDARSPSGALGLMQLMPGTAQHVAQGLGQPTPSRLGILEPETNIALGSAYLSSMLQRFDGNIVLATAAYNAGPGRVSKWLPKKPYAADIWIESIPYQETRTYVQRVMAYMILYENRLGLKPGSISQRLSPINPK